MKTQTAETKNKQWNEATTNIYTAISSLMQAQVRGINAWIEVQKNGEQQFPVRIKNPALDNPFNWVSSYGVPTRSESESFFNATDEDLTRNWTSAFGTKEAIEKYQMTGELSEGLLKGMGINYPIRQADFRKLRPDLPSNFNLWVYYWKPKTGIDYWIVDESIEKVYVVMFNDDEFNADLVLQNLKEFVNSIESL